MKNFKLFLWKFCCVGMFLLTILVFSPLVIPPGQYEPMVAGMPLTLWAGIAVVLMMVFLTLLAAYACSGPEDNVDDSGN